jgi:hypothetical protein
MSVPLAHIAGIPVEETVFDVRAGMDRRGGDALCPRAPTVARTAPWPPGAS